MNNGEVKETSLISTASSLERHTRCHLCGSLPCVGKPFVEKMAIFFLNYTYSKYILKIKPIFPSSDFKISLLKGETWDCALCATGPAPPPSPLPHSGSSGPCPGRPYLVAHRQLSSWALPDPEHSQAVIYLPSYKRVANLYNFVFHSQKSQTIKAEQFKNIEKEKKYLKFHF